MNHKKLLLTLTLCLCALLCMVVTASASEVSVHSHPICGATHTDIGDHTGACEAVTWTAWDGTSEIAYDSTTKTAYIYLADNVNISNALTIPQGHTLYLCLNDHSITKTSEDYDESHNRSDANGVIDGSAGNVTFALCNCKTNGTITHTSGKNGRGVWVKGTFIMYGGAITKNKADYGGGVSTSGDTANFTMYGGSITENHANKSGGGIYSTSDNISIYGGSVTDNSVTKRGKAGGIYVSDSGTLTVGGNVNISGNWQGDSEESGSKNNVYLDYYNGAFATIVIKEALTGAPIGITTANAPTAGNPVTIVTGNSIEETYKDSFQADNAAYGVSYNSTDKVLQLHKHSGGTATCTAEAVCTTCGQRYGDRNLNNHALVHHEAQAPTCTAVGWEAYDTCSRCDYSTTKVEIPMAAHTYGAPTYVWAANNASCTATRTCTACQHVENETVNTQQTVTQNHSCTLNELSTFTATFTNTAFAQQIKENVKTADMTGHTYSATEWESNVDNHWHECSACHTQIDKAEHTWKDATYTAPKTCTVCGATTGTKLSAYYYYSPAKTEDTPVSPKAGDPGVLLYAGLALTSLAGLACTAKKRH